VCGEQLAVVVCDQEVALSGRDGQVEDRSHVAVDMGLGYFD